MKEYKEKTQEEALHRAKWLNKKFKTLKNNQTWGEKYYKWVFSADSVIVTYERGLGSIYDGDATIYLAKGTAYKVGRDTTDLERFNKTVVCR